MRESTVPDLGVPDLIEELVKQSHAGWVLVSAAVLAERLH
jgi:hypothetical protein